LILTGDCIDLSTRDTALLLAMCGLYSANGGVHVSFVGIASWVGDYPSAAVYAALMSLLDKGFVETKGSINLYRVTDKGLLLGEDLARRARDETRTNSSDS
jgi:hypothetical protein